MPSSCHREGPRSPRERPGLLVQAWSNGRRESAEGRARRRFCSGVAALQRGEPAVTHRCAAVDRLSSRHGAWQNINAASGSWCALAALIVDAAMFGVEMACRLPNTALVRHLDCVARHSADGGIYLLEMTHPGSNFGVGSATESEWTAGADGLRKHTCCCAAGDSFDPVTQIDEVTVTMTWSGPGGQGPLVGRARRRRITANEVDALVRADGPFEVIELLDSLAQATPFTNEL